MLALVLHLALNAPGARGETESFSRADRRVAERLASSISPLTPPAQVRAWSKSRGPSERSAYDPEAFATRIIDLVRQEIEHQAEGYPSDENRLMTTLGILFEAAHAFSGGPLTFEQRKALRGLRWQQSLISAAGAATVPWLLFMGTMPPGFTSFEWTFSSATLIGIMIGPVLILRRELANLPRGAFFATARANAAAGWDRFLSALDARLREDPAWREKFPHEAPDFDADGLKTMLEMVWLPATMQASCERFFAVPTPVPAIPDRRGANPFRPKTSGLLR